MTNAIRHAEASCCRVSILFDGSLRLEVTDDGNGRPPERRGTGLVSMRDRAEELGGSCRVTFRPGSGTEVAAVLPVEVAT